MNLVEDVIARKREAESVFCAAAYQNPNIAMHECGWLNPEMFTDLECRAFWAAMQEGKPPIEAAFETNTFQKIVQIMGTQISLLPSEVRAGARAIADEAYQIEVAKALPEIAQAVGVRDKNKISDLLAKLNEQKPVGAKEIPTALDAAIEFDDALYRNPNYIKTYLPPLDRAIVGLDRQTLTIIGARPSMGKTALAFQLARMMAEQHRVIYFSLEMSQLQLWRRAVAGLCGVPLDQLRKNEFTQEQKENMSAKSMEAASRYADRLRIDDTPGVTTDYIWEKVARYKPDVIFVDHLGLMTEHWYDNSIPKKIGLLTAGGKKIAKEFNLCAVYLAQLSRETAKGENKNKMPTLTDLRDSGEIEQDADNVIFIHRDDYYEDPKAIINPISNALLNIAKFRDGERGRVVGVDYHLKEQWFTARGERL